MCLLILRTIRIHPYQYFSFLIFFSLKQKVHSETWALMLITMKFHSVRYLKRRCELKKMIRIKCRSSIKRPSWKTLIIYFSEFLSASLNVKKCLGNEHVFRDWRGFASLLFFSRNHFNIVELSKNEFEKLLAIWNDSYTEANFNKLLNILKKIQRYDIFDDVRDFLGLFREIFHLLCVFL